jgi:hypothetical protein
MGGGHQQEIGPRGLGKEKKKNCQSWPEASVEDVHSSGKNELLYVDNNNSSYQCGGVIELRGPGKIK